MIYMGALRADKEGNKEPRVMPKSAGDTNVRGPKFKGSLTFSLWPWTSNCPTL